MTFLRVGCVTRELPRTILDDYNYTINNNNFYITVLIKCVTGRLGALHFFHYCYEEILIMNVSGIRMGCLIMCIEKNC